MLRHSRLLSAFLAAVAGAAGQAHAQDAAERWTSAKGVKCEFRTLATGNWGRDGAPTGQVRTTPLSFSFSDINLDVGTADVDAKLGAVNAIVQRSGAVMHFILVGSAGYLHTTTVFDAQSRPGRLKAVHSRHEYTDIALPGYTSRPEQYYGECEIVQ
ncbi:MAG: hypothetical protein HY657_13575 [Acidobacteria bacterium]|nr:hypothetical protein [Acidobacteriota bacterium]